MTVEVVVALITVLSMMAARYLALRRGRAPVGWVWAAAFLGPIPIVALAILPDRHRA